LNLKKSLSLLLMAVLLVQLLALSGAYGAQPIKVVINGKDTPFDPPPIMVKGRVMVPMRQVLETLGAKVEWDAANQTVTAKRGLTTIKITVDEDFALVNGSFKELDVPARLINGKTYVPLRFVGQSLGAKVNWDQATWTVSITLELPKLLEGTAALVRDSIYNVQLAQSGEFAFEAQVKIPEYPQLNLINVDGKKQNDTYSFNGHALGWFFEALYHNDLIYLKSIVFDDQWVGLKDFGLTDQEIKEIREENRKARQEYQDKEVFTEVVRALGKPVELGEETIDGVVTRKIQFTPVKDQYDPLADQLDIPQEVNELKVTVWVDPKEARLHKYDFEVQFYEKGQGGFIKLKGDYRNINRPVNITIPDIAKQ